MKQVPEWLQSKDLLDYPTAEQALYWEGDSGSGKGLKGRQIFEDSGELSGDPQHMSLT